jgi:hypothetical protein
MSDEILRVLHCSTRNTCMQQPLAYVPQTLFQHEVFLMDLSPFYYNHIEGKITQIWLANEEGIFS